MHDLLSNMVHMAEETFGTRLRAERERRKISLETIAANTKIGIGLLRALERDDVSRWPSGVFRRSFIRGYADAVGLDADETLKEFLEQFPDPFVGHVGVPAASTVDGRVRRLPQPSMRLALADDPLPFSGGRVLLRARHRLAAAACDALTVVAVATAAFVVLGAFWIPLAVAMLCYYLGGIILLGNTPGVCLLAPRAAGSDVAAARHASATVQPADAGMMADLGRDAVFDLPTVTS